MLLTQAPEETGPWGARPEAGLSLLRINSDDYASTKKALKAISRKIVPGTVILFDHYMGFPGWEDGPFKAWRELGRPYEYLARRGGAVLVKVTG